MEGDKNWWNNIDPWLNDKAKEDWHVAFDSVDSVDSIYSVDSVASVNRLIVLKVLIVLPLVLPNLQL